jgi:putative nucleotidyltransferase with HDIG domain
VSLRTRILINVKALPSMPASVVKLTRLINEPEVKIEEVIQILQLDTGLTARVLKLANSAALGLSRRVDSAQEAVVRIGMRQLYQIVVSASLKPIVDKELQGYDLDDGLFWRHSIAVAIAAEALAAKCRKEARNAFTAGIMHDVGKQIISDFIMRTGEQFDAADGSPVAFDITEREILGIDHAELAGAVLEMWQFPTALVNAARYHHTPDDTPDDQLLVDIVHVADALCVSAGLGIGRDSLRYALSSNAVARLGLVDETMDAVLCTTIDATRAFEELMKSA